MKYGSRNAQNKILRDFLKILIMSEQSPFIISVNKDLNFI